MFKYLTIIIMGHFYYFHFYCSIVESPSYIYSTHTTVYLCFNRHSSRGDRSLEWTCQLCVTWLAFTIHHLPTAHVVSKTIKSSDLYHTATHCSLRIPRHLHTHTPSQQDTQRQTDTDKMDKFMVSHHFTAYR